MSAQGTLVIVIIIPKPTRSSAPQLWLPSRPLLFASFLHLEPQKIAVGRSHKRFRGLPAWEGGHHVSVTPHVAVSHGGTKPPFFIPVPVNTPPTSPLQTCLFQSPILSLPEYGKISYTFGHLKLEAPPYRSTVGSHCLPVPCHDLSTP